MKKTRVFLIALMALVLIPTLAVGAMYNNTAPAFTVSYPDDWEKQEVKASEVLRVVKPGPYGIPVLTVQVAEKKADAKPLDQAGESFMKSVQATAPGSKRFKLLSEEVITLPGGEKAMAITFKWNLSPTTKLQSAAVMVYKGEKAVSLVGTTILGGYTSPKDLLEMCKQIQFK